MPTPRTRALVSLAAATLSLALGACAHRPAPAAGNALAAVQGPPATIRFDNEAQVHVHVYLVGPRREWLLGRVEPGARATLRIPPAAMADAPGFVQLAVVSGASVTGQAARDPRATLTIAQPASMLTSQRWRFSQRQLASPVLLGARADGR